MERKNAKEGANHKRKEEIHISRERSCDDHTSACDCTYFIPSDFINIQNDNKIVIHALKRTDLSFHFAAHLSSFFLR